MLGDTISEASRDVSSNLTASVLLAMGALLGASAVGAHWFSRRRSPRRPLAWFAALGSVAGCGALTLARDGLPQGFRPTNVFAWVGSGWDRLGHGELLGSSQFLLNCAMFVPAGVAWVWLTRRPAPTLLGLVGLSMVIESVQAMTALGAADITDVVANSIGASLGVATTAVVSLGTDHSRGSTPLRRIEWRRGVVIAVSVVAVLATALFVGAERRQASIHSELMSVFSDSSYEEIAAVLQGDPDDPERFELHARFTDAEQIFGAISVRSDGGRSSEHRIEMRWPATFFGLRRCVYVIWTPSAVEFRDRSGSACTDFIG